MQDENGAEGPTVRILYVEDDALLGQLFKNTFEDLGYAVDIAGRGQDALTMFGDFNHDIAAVDYQLPDISGLKVAEALLARAPELPIVFVAGEGSENVAAEAMALGVMNYVIKEGAAAYTELLPSIIGNFRRLMSERRDRLAKEKALRDSERRFRDLAEVSADWIWEMGPDLRFTYLSERAEEVTGIPVAEHIGRTREEIAGQRAAEGKWRDHLATLRRHEPFRDFRYHRRGPDGDMQFLSVSGVPIFDEEGEFRGYRGTGAELSERKKTEDDLRDRGVQFKVMTETSPNMMAIVRLSDGVITYANSAAERIVGLAADEIVGRRAVDFYADPADRDIVINRVAEDGMVQNFEFRLRCKDAPPVWASLNCRIADLRGEPHLFSEITDVSERRSAAEALAASEQRFKDFAETASDWVWESDAAHRLTVVEGSIFASGILDKAFFLGRTRHQFAGERNVLIDSEKWALHQADLDGHRPFRNFEYLVRDQDGERRYVRVNGKPLFDADGTFLGYRGTGSDITDLVLSERKLRSSQWMIDELLENTSQGFWHVDTERRTVDVNPAMCEIMGRERDDIIGRSGPEFFDDVNNEIVKTQLERRRRGAKGSYQVAIQRPDGTNVPCINTATPVYDEEGNRTGSIGLWTEIGDLKKAEIEIKAQNALIELLRRTTVIANEAGSHLEAMQRCLTAVCEFLGWPVGHVYRRLGNEAPRLVPSELWHMDDVEKFSAFRSLTARTVFESGVGLPGFVMESGKPLWIEEITANREYPRARAAGDMGIRSAVAFPVLVDGKVAAVLEFFSNERKDVDHRLLSALAQIGVQLGRVVERARIEEALRDAKARAEAASRAKSEFLSAMSHELRTPLNAILGFAQVLGSDPETPLTASQANGIDHILRGGHHLLALINQVLDLAKIEAGKLGLALDDLPVARVLDRCLSLIEPMAKKHGVTVTVGAGAERPLAVRADPTRLQQALLNLMTNAVKYNGVDGVVTVDCRETDTGMARITVADTGSGIPAEHLDELFQPFTRLGAENTETDGVGIGLTITKLLIENMDGRIGVDSRPGAGSTFWIDLPLGEQPAVEDGPPERSRPGTKPHVPPDGNGVVLYVEDNPANLELMEMIIERAGDLSMISAHNAELGVELAKIRRPDLIILDINLPGMDGFAALEHLQSDEKTRDIPVIALSADAMAKDIERGKAAGFKEYLTKPVRVDEVMVSIRNSIGG